MAFSTNLSRFDLLTDDAHDPFEKKKKASKSSTTQKKAAGKNTNGQNQGQGAGKKKKKVNANNNGTTTQVSTPVVEEFPELGATISEKQVRSNSINNNSPNGQPLPKEKRTKDQWSEWSKRDEEFVTDAYEADLEAALLQSKLDFESQSKLKPKASKKSKKKGVTVPLPDFNNLGAVDAYEVHGSDTFGQPSLNGFSENFGQPSNEDDPRLEQFRRESQLEIQRQRQIEMERKLINSRSPVFPVPVPSEKTREELNPVQVAYGAVIIEKDNTIAQLTNDKLELEKEIDLLKIRFKKLCSVLGDAQLKDKATLVHELEKVTKLNHDLNENIQELHKLLEQEKSKSHAALLEIRKLNEQTRRRNPHSESAQ